MQRVRTDCLRESRQVVEVGQEKSRREECVFSNGRDLCRSCWSDCLCVVELRFARLRTMTARTKPPTKPAAAKIEAPAPLTERERLLLDRVEQLEKRVADLEGKGNPCAASGADAAAVQPASTTPVASTAGVAAPGTTSGVKPTSARCRFRMFRHNRVVGPQATEKGKSARAKPGKAEPFAFADFTWLNGNPAHQRHAV